MNKFVTDLCKCGISVVGVLRKVSRYMLIISCLNPLSGKESFRLYNNGVTENVSVTAS